VGDAGGKGGSLAAHKLPSMIIRGINSKVVISSDQK